MKKIAGVIGLLLAVVFLGLALTTTVPDKHIRSYGTGKMTEYVGGDAYNFIIEASLRGGEIAGAQISKAIYFSVSGLLAVLSLALLLSSSEENLQSALSGIRKEIKDADHYDAFMKQEAEFQAKVLELLKDKTDPSEETGAGVAASPDDPDPIG